MLQNINDIVESKDAVSPFVVPKNLVLLGKLPYVCIGRGADTTE